MMQKAKIERNNLHIISSGHVRPTIHEGPKEKEREKKKRRGTGTARISQANKTRRVLRAQPNHTYSAGMP